MPWATIIEDSARNKTLADILKTPLSSAQNTGRKTVSFGFSNAAYWFVVPVYNPEDHPLKRLLIFEPPWLDKVQVTVVGENGERQVFMGGDTLPFSRRARPRRQINFNLQIPSGGSKLVVRVQTRDPFFVRMELMGQGAYDAFTSGESTYYGLFYGALLALMMFNFMLFVSAREKIYLAYSAYLAVFLSMYSVYNGFTFHWIFANSPELSNWAHSISIYLYSLAGLTFANVFLELKTRSPSVYLSWKIAVFAWAVSFVVTALPSGYRSHVIGSIVWVVIYSLFALYLGIVSLKNRNTAAGYYLGASIAGLTGSAVTSLTVMGMLPYTFLTFRAADAGMLVDAIMLSLALSERISRVNRLERLRRFFSPAVADGLLSESSEELYRPHHREIVVVFLDLRGYTAFTLKQGADEVMRVLGEFHEVMGRLIAAYGATLERFAGDGMMIFFNDPVEIPDPAIKACRMVQEMQDSFVDLNKIWAARNYTLTMGAGIAQGIATIGAIGFEGRRDYAAIGNVTNLAARLCSAAQGGQIVISSVVADNIRGVLKVQPLQPLPLKGYTEPVECYELAQFGEKVERERADRLLSDLAPVTT